MGQGGMRLNDGCCAEHAVEMLLRQRKVVNGGEWATGWRLEEGCGGEEGGGGLEKGMSVGSGICSCGFMLKKKKKKKKKKN